MARPARRSGCTPCNTERKVRAALASPLFPVNFPCRHPGAGPVPQCPVRYTVDRFCAGCGGLRTVEVVVQDPGTIGYRCDRGHKWLVRMPAPKSALARREP